MSLGTKLRQSGVRELKIDVERKDNTGSTCISQRYSRRFRVTVLQPTHRAHPQPLDNPLPSLSLCSALCLMWTPTLKRWACTARRSISRFVVSRFLFDWYYLHLSSPPTRPLLAFQPHPAPMSGACSALGALLVSRYTIFCLWLIVGCSLLHRLCFNIIAHCIATSWNHILCRCIPCIYNVIFLSQPRCFLVSIMFSLIFALCIVVAICNPVVSTIFTWRFDHFYLRRSTFVDMSCTPIETL